MTRRINQSGVTVVELLVVMVVSSLIIGVVTGFALNYWGKTITLNNDQATLVSRLNAGDYLRNGIDSAAGMISQNDLPDSHTLNPDPGDGTGMHWLTIHAVPSTIPVGATGTYTPLVYYSRPSVDTSKNIILNGTIPYQDNIILYLNGTTKQLLARTIANPYATGNRALTSCPENLATNSCPADTVVAENVSSIGTRYFSRSGNPIDYTSIIDTTTGNYIGPDFPSVEIVEFTLNLAKNAQFYNANDTSNQTVIRIALRN